MPFFIFLTSLSKLYKPFSRETLTAAAFPGQNTEDLQKEVTVQTGLAIESLGGGYSALHLLGLLVLLGS